MSRLAAIEKALYYPSPERVMRLIARSVNFMSTGRLLDICAGEGTAASILAQEWGIESYGIELHGGRAEAASKVLTKALHGSYHQLATQDKAFNVLFLNPPYDQGKDENNRSIRQEVMFLQDALRYLNRGGLLVFIPPRHILGNEHFQAVMRQNFNQIEVFSFPEPEVHQFNQVIVIARKTDALYARGYVPQFEGNMPPAISEDTQFLDGREVRLNTPEELVYFEATAVNPLDLAPSWEDREGAFGTSQWDILTGTDDLAYFDRPLLDPREGHRAMLLAAGCLNGTEITGNRLVKGNSEKIVVETSDPEEEVTIKREQVVSNLSVLDLNTGELDSWRVDQDLERTRAWFQENGDQLAAAIERDHKALFPGNVEDYDWDLVQAPGILPGHDKPELLAKQKESAAAISYHWRSNKSAVLSGEMGVGKAQPLHAKVLTPSGWVPMGDLRVGDLVIDPEGGTSKIVGVFPQGTKPVYRVTFSDGAQTECCDEHLWSVNTPLRRWRKQPPRIKSLSEVRQQLHDAAGNRKHFVPLTAPVDFTASSSLPLDPYLMGVLLGDGGITHAAKVSSVDQGILDAVTQLLPPGTSLRHDKGCDYYITTGCSWKKNPVKQALRGLGLLGKRSEEKHIPEEYLYSSTDHRIALLQGLLDTDGSVAGERGSCVEYTSTSQALTDGVVSLVRSLGGVASCAKRQTTYTHKGRERKGQFSYRIVASLPPHIRPFRLGRKSSLYTPGKKYGPSRAIERVELIGEAECQCIMVDSESHLYITDDFIVTHNTVCAIAATALSGFKKVVVIMPGHLVDKWVREAETVTKSPGCAIIGKKLTDVDRFFADPKKHFLILSKERAKLGARWRGAVAKGKRIFQVEDVEYRTEKDYWGYSRQVQYKVMVNRTFDVCQCPSCGEVLRDEDGNLLTEDAFSKKKRACPECSERLWQSTPISDKGTKRWALARYINRRYSGKYACIVDECFPGHTRVSTPQGEVPIKDLTPGDRVWSRTKQGEVVARRVVRVLENPRLHRLVRVHHEQGSFVCTEDHKIWTGTRGYVRAQYLTNTDTLVEITGDADAHQDLSDMPGAFRVREADSQREENLLPSMWSKAPVADQPPPSQTCAAHRGDLRMVPQDRTGAGHQAAARAALLQPSLYPESGLEGEHGAATGYFCQDDADQCPPRISGSILGTNARTQPESRDQGQDHRETPRADLRKPGGQWTANSPTGNSAQGAGLGDGARSCHRKSQMESGGGRSCGTLPQDCDRVRRSVPSHEKAEEPGPQEGTDARSLGMGGIEVLELPGGQRVGSGAPGNPSDREIPVIAVETCNDEEDVVYDIEVEDTHCYFAEGVLVSNCHQYAAPDTDQSRAVQHLMTSATNLLAMTGTLYGGRASSIFFLLYKVDRQFREMYEYNDCPVFVSHHGLLEEIIDTSERTSTYGTKRGGVSKTREIPGVNPAMITLLLSYTVFLRLEDLGYDLPPFEERVVVLPPGQGVSGSMSILLDDIKGLEPDVKQRVLSQYLMTALGFPDRPDRHEEIIDKGKWGYYADVVATVDPLDTTCPKDDWLVTYALKQKAKDRKVLVYFTQVNKRSPVERVKARLEEAGLKVSVLGANISPAKREAWLQRVVKKENPDVLLTNGRLVETGLDLIEFPSIVQYGIEYSVPSLRQSTRRSWRLGQTQPVEVTYLAYAGTLQETAIYLISQKMRASETVDGDETGGLGKFDESGEDLFLEMARQIIARAA